ncbi:MAG: hypothetical protein WB988_22855 [Candidatus Nitrosopolaris sp.]
MKNGKLVFFEFIEEGSTIYTIAHVSQILGLNPALDEHPVRTIIKRVLYHVSNHPNTPRDRTLHQNHFKAQA